VTDHGVDVKIIAAAQWPLSQRVADGRFRSDLYHRLALVVLEIPALRDRGDDVLGLARHFLHRYTSAHGVDPKQLTESADAWLRAHSWPGNVRELSHLMERVVLLLTEPRVDAAALERLALPRPITQDRARAGTPDVPPDSDDEIARIRRAIAQSKGNILGAARLLGLTRNALRYRMQRLNIQAGTDADEELAPAPGKEVSPC
jgi:DNA-binding NtrC family response regulator